MNQFEFWATMVGHVFSWPAAVVFSVLILKEPLGKLLGRLLSAEGPGGIKASFSELIADSKFVAVRQVETQQAGGKTETDVKSDPPPGQAEGTGSEGPEEAGPSVDDLHSRSARQMLRKVKTRMLQRDRNDLYELASRRPEMAVSESWNYLHNELVAMARSTTGNGQLDDLPGTMNHLEGLGILTTSESAEVWHLWSLRSSVAQLGADSVQVDLAGAIAYVSQVMDFVEMLDGRFQKFLADR